MTIAAEQDSENTLTVTPLSPAVGAEISGVDLREDLSPQTIADIIAAWHKHLVLVFRNQTLSEDEQIRERFEFTSFRRPYDAKAYHAILDWLYQHFPTPAEGYPERVEQIAAREATPPFGEK